MREWAYSQFACFHLALALCIYRTEQNEMVCCGPVYGIASSDTAAHKHNRKPAANRVYYTDTQPNPSVELVVLDLHAILRLVAFVLFCSHRVKCTQHTQRTHQY